MNRYGLSGVGGYPDLSGLTTKKTTFFSLSEWWNKTKPLFYDLWLKYEMILFSL